MCINNNKKRNNKDVCSLTSEVVFQGIGGCAAPFERTTNKKESIVFRRSGPARATW